MTHNFLASLAAMLLFPMLVTGYGEPTSTQSLNVKQAVDVQIATDGRHVAYELREPNWDDNAFKSNTQSGSS